MAREITLTIPAMHAGQAEVWNGRRRFNVCPLGRRVGKTTLLADHLALTYALDKKLVGVFVPQAINYEEIWRELLRHGEEVIDGSNANKRTIEFAGGGRVDFWTCHNNPDVGRGFKYHLALVDESGLLPNLISLFDEAISATLMDYQGEAWFFGTPKGKGAFYALYLRGQSDDPVWEDWASWRMPTSVNPYILPSEIERMRASMTDRSYRQEILAEFLDGGDGVFPDVAELVESGTRHRAGLGAQIGVDVAKSRDYVVITVLDADGRQLEIHRWTGQGFKILHERVLDVAARHPDAVVRIDSTGMGDPLYEGLRLALGHERVEGFHFTWQGKQDLIDALVLRVERKGLSLLDHKIQLDELEAYELQTTPKGKPTYNAPKGLHDDCVIALALAAWGLRAGAARQRTFCFYG